MVYDWIMIGKLDLFFFCTASFGYLWRYLEGLRPEEASYFLCRFHVQWAYFTALGSKVYAAVPNSTGRMWSGGAKLVDLKLGEFWMGSNLMLQYIWHHLTKLGGKWWKHPQDFMTTMIMMMMINYYWYCYLLLLLLLLWSWWWWSRPVYQLMERQLCPRSHAARLFAEDHGLSVEDNHGGFRQDIWMFPKSWGYP